MGFAVEALKGDLMVKEQKHSAPRRRGQVLVSLIFVMAILVSVTMWNAVWKGSRTLTMAAWLTKEEKAKWSGLSGLEYGRWVLLGDLAYGIATPAYPQWSGTLPVTINGSQVGVNLVCAVNPQMAELAGPGVPILSTSVFSLHPLGRADISGVGSGPWEPTIIKGLKPNWRLPSGFRQLDVAVFDATGLGNTGGSYDLYLDGFTTPDGRVLNLLSAVAFRVTVKTPDTFYSDYTGPTVVIMPAATTVTSDLPVALTAFYVSPADKKTVQINSGSGAIQIISGAGTIQMTTWGAWFTPGGPGTVTIRATYGTVFSDLTFTVVDPKEILSATVNASKTEKWWIERTGVSSIVLSKDR